MLLPLDLPLTRWPVTAFLITLVLLRNSKTRELRLWYAEGEPLYGPTVINEKWQPLEGLRERAKDWHVWYWRKTFTFYELEVWLSKLREGRLETDEHVLPLEYRERPWVFLHVEGNRPLLCPQADQSTWLKEFWDDLKHVTALGDEAWVRRVNASVHHVLGVDLNYWQDRIGNFLLFAPSGIMTEWNYDELSQTAVIQTNLLPTELGSYEIELQVWEGEEITYRRRQPLSEPAAIFKDVRIFREIQATVWKSGQLVHQEGPISIIKASLIDMEFTRGTRRGTTYTYSGPPTRTGETSEPTWIRSQRDRRVAERKQYLADNLEFVFYEPSPNNEIGNSRTKAVADIRAILAGARENVRIWDPYFGAAAKDAAPTEELEDLQLLEGVRRLSVVVEILTSCEDWRESVSSPTLDKLGQRLEALRLSFPERYENVHCKAWVRAKETAFHDRFIIVDRRDVWMLGSSMNGLGKKHSTLVKLDLAEEVISAFDRLWRGEQPVRGSFVEVTRAP